MFTLFWSHLDERCTRHIYGKGKPIILFKGQKLEMEIQEGKWQTEQLL